MWLSLCLLLSVFALVRGQPAKPAVNVNPCETGKLAIKVCDLGLPASVQWIEAEFVYVASVP
jgi:hypothetical protein